MKVRLLLQIIRLTTKNLCRGEDKALKTVLPCVEAGDKSSVWFVLRVGLGPRDVESLRSSVGMHKNMNLGSSGWSVVLFEVRLLFAVFAAVAFVTSCLWIVRLHCV